METDGIMGRRGLSLAWMLLFLVMLASYTGTHAQCSGIVCENGGQCTVMADGPECQCLEGFSGDLCQVVGDVNDCSTPSAHACQNNAKCVDGLGNYTCDCLSGWEGRFCEKEKNECEAQPCQNGGNCTDKFDRFTCDCPAAFTGVTCASDVDECQGQDIPLCQNGAVCRNEIGSFSCECASGYIGSLCQTEIDECDSSPCYFGGKCVDLINNFRCECLDGFAGPQCQGVVQECLLSDVCGDNGICIGKPLGGYECFCKPGYFGDHCETQVNLCSANPCRNRAACINYGTSYSCTCLPGYTGENCEEDIDECVSQPCLNNGTCSQNAATPADYTCQCVPGFTGQTCDTDVDECAGSPCPDYKVCRDLVNGFRCHCPPGKTGDLCTTDIFDCRVSPCLNGGSCVLGTDSESDRHICTCPSPFTSETCSTSLDPCIPNPCIHGGRCNQRTGINGTDTQTNIGTGTGTGTGTDNGTGFWCDCLDGYVGVRCEGDVYDCLSNPCLNNGTCLDVPYRSDDQEEEEVERVKFECNCREGFTGRLCETEIDACWGNDCRNEANCTIIKDSDDYECHCTQEWTGTRCDVNVNECLAIPTVCQNSGQCIDLTPGFRCVCPEPWTGDLCEKRIIYCNNDTCKNGGTCEEGPEEQSPFFTCQCPDEYTGTDCSKQISPCRPNPCINNSTCVPNTTNITTSDGNTSSFTCQCQSGYTGKRCEGNIDECTILKPCKNNGTCRDGIGSFTCDCTQRWKGPLCDVAVNACSSNPQPCENGGTCNATEDGYKCDCLQGYNGSKCEQKVAQCQAKPCQNNATCVEEDDGFSCQCVPGFTGDYCEVNVDNCSPTNPCNGTATCQDLVDGFRCVCPQGFTGKTCSEKVKACDGSPCKFGGICNEADGGRYYCTCPSGVEGTHCQTIITASFNGDSVMDLPSVTTLMTSLGDSGTGANEESSPIRRKRRSTGLVFNNFDIKNMYSMEQGIAINDVIFLDEKTENSFSFDHDTLNKRLYLRDNNNNDVLVRTRRDAHDGDDDDNGQVDILISFTFTTTVIDGILLLTTGTSKDGHPQHAVIELKGSNKLLISLSNGLQTLIKVLTLDSPSSQIHSHAVELTIRALTSTLKVTSSSCTNALQNDGSSSCPSVTLTFQNATQWHLDGSFHFGGVGEFSTYTRSIVTTTSGFTGCLGNLAINGKTVNLGEATQWGDPATTTTTTTSSASSPSSPPQPGCDTHPPCMPDSCQNGGRCIDLWLSKKCDCPVGFTGEKCEIQNVAHFGSEDMLYLGSFDAITDIAFQISANQTTGLLMYTLAGDAISLSVDNSSIKMVIVFQAAGSDLVSKVGSDLDLLNWIKVHLQLTDNSYLLEVSTEKTGVSGSVQGTARRNIRSYGPLFVGRLHPHPALNVWRTGESALKYDKSLIGCVRDFTMNGKRINILDAGPSSLGNDPPKPRAGCIREESCVSHSCSNQGVCVSGWAGATCVCDQTFNGHSCDNPTAYTFDGTTSYSLLEIDRTLVGFGDSGSLEFRTRQDISTLMLIQVFKTSGGSDTIEFRLFSGYLQIFSSFTEETMQSKAIVSDGNWHIMVWRRQRDLLFLTLDNDTFYLRASFDPYHPDLNHTVDIYVGARPLSAGTDSHIVGFFQGCIRNVTFNAHLINLAASGEQDNEGQGQHSGILSQPTSIVSGCQNSSVCGVNPCPANSYCKDEWNAFSCPCLPGWEGSSCNQSTDDCKLNVCQNSAICIDHHLSYTCSCPEQFTGRLCETAYEPCQEQVCSLDNTISCMSYNYSYFVCECKPGYTGKLCESLIDNCASGPCLYEASCLNEVNNYTCDCREGFLGRQCHIKDYCISKPCFNGGTCSLNNLDTAKNNNTQSSTIDTSVSPSSSSSSSSSSTSSNSSSTSLPYNCECLAPYFGLQCQEFDYCQQNLCKNNATCVLKSDKYICNCSDGYYGTYCEFKDHCFVKPCLNGGECRNSVDSHTCICPFYFTGTNCEIPVNQCLNNICLNGASCIFNATSSSSSSSSSSNSLSSTSSTASRSYECICLEGFNGTNCEIDINECLSNPCQNNATCIESASLTRNNFFPGYRCECVEGFTGLQCKENVDDCVVNPCQNGGSCEDRVNGYHCICLDGFVNQDCSVDKRGCGSNPCLNGATCRDEGDGNYTCVCDTGFEGVLCERNEDDCLQHECVNGGVCVDGVNNYTCNCLSGYAGGRCNEIVDACYTQPCHHGGVCTYRGLCSCVDVVIACGWHDEVCQSQRCQERDDCVPLSPAYSCDCSGTGHKGTQCTEDVDECDKTTTTSTSSANRPCPHGGACINTVGGFQCDCSNTGYEGDLCQVDIDECLPTNPCFNAGTCVNTVGSFQCQCLDAWTGDLCGLKRDFCDSQPCLNNGICTSGVDAYTCDCDGTGFEGNTCAVNIDDCVNNRCEHGSVCRDGARQYTCVCDGTGYTGQFCQEPSSSCASLYCLNNGSCVVVSVSSSNSDSSSSSSNDGTVTCLCHGTGYHGHRCQYDDDECQDGNHLCKSVGVAQCVNNAGSYTCHCQAGYTGQYCQTALFRNDDSSSADVSDGVIAVCVLLVLFLVLMLSLYLLWQWKRKRKTQGRYKPSQVEGVIASGEIPLDKLAARDERLI